VEQLLGYLTLEEKIGQLVQADIDSITPADLAQYPLGSILAGGNAAPGGDVHASGAKWLDLTDALFRASLQNSSAKHPPIPILFGIDAVHGHAKIRGATVFPHNVGLGATHDPALIEKIGRATAQEVSATGIDWTFAPTVAVVRDVRWGRSYESYSEDPALVASYARSMVTGLQGKLGSPDFLSAGHTLASAKHFMGDGGTLAGRDQFNNTADERTLRDVHAAGYPAALAAGDLIVMASYNSWHGIKMHANRSLLTDVLKDRWRFPGFVVGDWNAQEEIPGCSKFSCPQFLNAGGDMYMAPDSWKQLYANLLKQVAAGQIPQSRVDDAVRRVLRVKVIAGQLGKRPPKQRGESLDTIGSAAHRELARQAVRESLVLLKNNHHTLPLDPQAHILVIGPGADDIGMQGGGWTVNWQGDHNTNADFPGGTSILEGIKAAVAAAGGQVTTRIDDIDRRKPDAAIVVYGETPYAEFEGDRQTLEFSQPDAAHLETLRRLHVANIPVISLFISGRPMWVNRELNLSNAFVALWLPGTEGEGVADMLFKPLPGQPRYEFTGRLGFSWPATAMPVSFDADDQVQGALFPRGFGLSLAKSGELAQLAEDPRIPAELTDRDTLFHAGHVTAPWSIYVSDPIAETRLTMQSQVTPEKAVTVQLASQAVEVQWSGSNAGQFRIGGRAVSLSASPSEALRLHYRVAAIPKQRVVLSMGCEAPPGSSASAAAAAQTQHCGMAPNQGADLTATFRSANKGSWATLTIPLSCLARSAGVANLVSSPLVLDTSGEFAVGFDEIRLVRDAPASGCPR
jgi:beta-glucosidase